MPAPADKLRVVHFGVFEVDLQEAELRKSGIRIKLQEQPFQILTMFLERPGQTVTREELRQKLWPADTFVDFDHGLNAAIRRLREALDDSADTPRFIETVARRGYRFIAPVDGRAPAPDMRDRLKHSVRWQQWAAIGATIAIALAAVGTRYLRPSKPARIGSVAVLPFTNEGGDPQQQYFADGMTEELITELSQVSSLKVISRTSVMRYKGTSKALPEIAKDLGVDGIIEGSVLRSGDRVRITAQLIHAPSDTHLWAKRYEGDLRDVLTLQSDVALAIVGEVKSKVTSQEQTRLAAARTVNPEAYELYLKGRYEWNKRTEEGLKKSLEYFQQAISLDPNYALAYSGVADSYSTLANNSLAPGIVVYPKAKAAALKALELDATSAEAHSSLAFVVFEYDRNPEAALKEFQVAIKLNPNSATAHHWYAYRLAEMGRSEEAFREIEQARRLDPLSIRINANVALILYFGRQYDRAIIAARKALELEPNDSATLERLGDIYLQKGMPAEALAEFRRVSKDDYPEAYAAAGNRKEAFRILRRLKEQPRSDPYGMARAYTGLGQKDEAMLCLQKGVNTYAGGMDRLKVEPAFDPLRSDSRFQELLRRMNFLQ